MFNFDSIVDTVQGAQKSFVETYVADKKVQADLVKLVDSQAKFAKTTYKTSLEFAETFAKNVSDATKSVTSKKVGA
jgi:hypothetical protein